MHGCRDVTEYLQLLLRKSGYNFRTTAEKEVVRILKEKSCYIAQNPVKEEKEMSGKVDDFVLPDGNVVKVNRKCCSHQTKCTCIYSSLKSARRSAQKDSEHRKSCFSPSL